MPPPSAQEPRSAFVDSMSVHHASTNEALRRLRECVSENSAVYVIVDSGSRATATTEELCVEQGGRARSDGKTAWESLDALEEDMAKSIAKLEENVAKLKEDRAKFIQLKEDTAKFKEDTAKLKEDTTGPKEDTVRLKEGTVKSKEVKSMAKLDERIAKLEEDRAKRLRAELYSSLCSALHAKWWLRLSPATLAVLSMAPYEDLPHLLAAWWIQWNLCRPNQFPLPDALCHFGRPPKSYPPFILELNGAQTELSAALTSVWDTISRADSHLMLYCWAALHTEKGQRSCIIHRELDASTAREILIEDLGEATGELYDDMRDFVDEVFESWAGKPPRSGSVFPLDTLWYL